ncbi:RiPP maturation radical SAM C-methyltransferase [Prochlorococcus sp. MIT 1303]|uniref:RiPP maturation radical SAM C-methyltransferase n=1 Tax=Prochlorococcus sp. MIT 1303 TaxID=1723647 RepID=UPI0007B3E711|nr:RiPP maturation radical SAM C-methyltransferase [Prochlorococcus sp. MIT 1303]KZR68139.1 Radical SAM superfamily protein [Prochlorococcus sp. MIT 1303]
MNKPELGMLNENNLPSGLNEVGSVDVVFAQMPYHALTHPALGPSILKTCLHNVGIKSRINYYYLKFAQIIGLDRYCQMLNSKSETLKGEWTFARSAFGSTFLTDRENDIGDQYPYISQEMVEIEHLTSGWIMQVARDILRYRPRILIASSMFQQNLACLALIKAVKSISPQIITVMGGPNTDGVLGLALLRRCNLLDFICTGDGEVTLPELCISILNRQLNTELPVGVYAQYNVQDYKGMFEGDFPRGLLTDLDLSPYPDFSDYFEQLEDCSFLVKPGILLESSRGCWWGQRKQCTFCGLNGTSMSYRLKSPDHTLDMLKHTTAKYRIDKVFFVDNILSKSYLDDFIPRLHPEQLSLFYEIKANVSESHIKTLAEGGVRFVQPGIESLSTHLLKLMRKGSSTLVNIKCLRLCREYGIRPNWSLLSSFPGEELKWYQDMIDLMPKLFHLRPPDGIHPIRFDRFSPYVDNPKEWKLNLNPSDAYQYIYPPYQDSHVDIARFFQHQVTKTDLFGKESWHSVHWDTEACVNEWINTWINSNKTNNSPPYLVIALDEDDQWSIRDTRQINTPEIITPIDVALVNLLQYCRDGKSPSLLPRLVTSGLLGDSRHLSQVLDLACANSWLILVDGQYLTLAQNHNYAPPHPSCFPAGVYQSSDVKVHQLF